MDKKSKNTLIVSIIALALVLIGVTYAYFSARITGLESASTLSLTAGRMGIVYSEGDENISVSNIYPREEAWLTKVFTLTGYNTTDMRMSYDVHFNIITNTFPNNYLTYDLKVLESTNGKPIGDKTGIPINDSGVIRIGKGYFVSADGDIHRYELKIYFKDNGLDQNDGQGAIFNAKISIMESDDYNCSVDINSLGSTARVVTSYDFNYNNCVDFVVNIDDLTQEEAASNCSDSNNTKSIVDNCNSRGDWYNEESYCYSLIQNGVLSNLQFKEVPMGGATYVNGQYTYTYLQGIIVTEDGERPVLIENGWSVKLTDKESTAPVTSKVCKSINGEPVTDMGAMFYQSKATSIDLSSFDTSEVENMSGMFASSKATSLDLSSFDTYNVTNMSYMFKSVDLSSLDLSSFDTSNVANMVGMFSSSSIPELDLGSFNTSNVTRMDKMFSYADILNLNLRSFDTLNVEYMGYMFNSSTIRTLDLHSFDTSSVIDFIGIFSYMPNLTTILVSDRFVVSDDILSYSEMFRSSPNLVGENGTTYDANHIGKEYAHIDGGPSNPGYFTNYYTDA